MLSRQWRTNEGPPGGLERLCLLATHALSDTTCIFGQAIFLSQTGENSLLFKKTQERSEFAY